MFPFAMLKDLREGAEQCGSEKPDNVSWPTRGPATTGE